MDVPAPIIEKNTKSIKEYIEILYKYFIEEILTDEFTYYGLRIIPAEQPNVDRKHGGFWHLITKDYLKENGYSVDLPCRDGNFPVCQHNCKKFHDYDPFRTLEYLPFNEEQKKNDKPRHICINRCERLSWVKAIIKMAEKNDSNIQIWEKNYRNNEVRTNIWCEEMNFLIILSKREGKNYYRLVTTFVTHYKDARARYEKEYENYLKNGKTPI